MIFALQILCSITVGCVAAFAILCCLFGVSETLDEFFEHRVIPNCDRLPYLHRWYIIRWKHFSLFVHKFVRSDEDRALHDHPWAFLVIPVWRGYIEHSEWELLPDHPSFEFWDQHPGCHRTVDTNGVRRVIRSKRRVWPILGTRFRSATYRHRVELLYKREEPAVCHCGELVEDHHTGMGHAPVEMEQSYPLPSWSLFFHFTKKRDWGFWPGEGFVHWNKWWQDKCE